MNHSADERYRQHLDLAAIGPAGQARLLSSRALVVGAGGLGCAALPYLVGAGIGAVVVCDGDHVERSNLPRQVLYGDDDVGRPKAATAVARLAPLNRSCALEAVGEMLSAANADRLVAAADVVLDATDNFAARYRLHDACFRARRALVTAAVHHDEGQLAVFRFDLGTRGPCWRCLWPAPPQDEDCVGDCRRHGILATVPGVLGVLQADQALRVLLEASPLDSGQLVHLDLTALSTWRTTWTAAPGCPLCGNGVVESADAARTVTAPVPRAAPAMPTTQPTPADLPEEIEREHIAAPADWIWVDARTEAEQAAYPASAFLDGIATVSWRQFGPSGPPPALDCVVICGHGISSLALARHWRDRGCRRVCSLRGGLAAQRRSRT